MNYCESPTDPYALYDSIISDPYLNQLLALPAPQVNSSTQTTQTKQGLLTSPNIHPTDSIALPTTKSVAEFSSPSSGYSTILSATRRHLVAISRSRRPISNDYICNPIMNEVMTGTFTSHLWMLVYELVGLEGVNGDSREKQVLKVELVEELVRCVNWDVGMNAKWEAERLVEDLWPLDKK
ncbi:hypothetical protein SLS60_010848 [Paraconiothyrium brasiliense]|uniref:Uncharacterized protein n=1 Tax=Paraconiothyrium brasiliense TaxID=300254 RepID=A0ABR3QM59_9PLEO